jgi:hypothetical protein
MRPLFEGNTGRFARLHGNGSSDELFVRVQAWEVLMVVSRDYMLKKESGPSAPKLFLDTKVIPAAVNMLGTMEVFLDRASARSGLRPRWLLAGAVGLGAIGLFGVLGREARRPEPAPLAPDPAL